MYLDISKYDYKSNLFVEKDSKLRIKFPKVFYVIGGSILFIPYLNIVLYTVFCSSCVIYPDLLTLFGLYVIKKKRFHKH